MIKTIKFTQFSPGSRVGLWILLLSVLLYSCEDISEDLPVEKIKWNTAILDVSEDPFVVENINRHFGSVNKNIGIEPTDILTNRALVYIDNSIYRYVLRIKEDPSYIGFRNYVLEYKDGLVFAILIEFRPNPDWYYRTQGLDVDWSKFSGLIINTDLNDMSTNTVKLIDGKNESTINENGRVEDLVCEYNLIETVTDWYQVNSAGGPATYLDTQTTYSYQYTCSGGTGVGGLSIPTGGTSGATQTAQVNCEVAGGCQAVVHMLYDVNQDPVTIPCKGSPLDNMAIMTNNQGVQSNRFGCVRSGTTCSNGTKGNHHGIDLQANLNTTVHSITTGTLAGKNFDEDGWGYYVIIKSGNMRYLYGHLKEASPIEWGVPITVNQVIGHSGESGNASEPHLHLEVRENTGGAKTSYNNMEKKDPEDHMSSNFDGAGTFTGDDC